MRSEGVLFGSPHTNLNPDLLVKILKKPRKTTDEDDIMIASFERYFLPEMQFFQRHQYDTFNKQSIMESTAVTKWDEVFQDYIMS